MKIILQTIIFSFFLILFMQSCEKDESTNSPTTNSPTTNYFKVGTNIYPLANAGYFVDTSDYTVLILNSPGLTINWSNFSTSGTGDYLEFDIENVDSILDAGTYYSPNGFSAFIGLNCSPANNNIGNEYIQDFNLPGSLAISKSNSTYTVNFQFTLDTGQPVTGQYIGPITRVQ